MTDTAGSGPSGEKPGPDWQARLDDGAVLRWAFFGLLAGTLCMLFLDYQEMGAESALALGGEPARILPPFDPTAPGGSPAGSPMPEIRTERAALEAPMVLDLLADGVLTLTGMIEVGSAETFAEEIERRGSYVKTVSLASPGGSVDDALAIGTLIRDKGFSTRVDAGALCASSCPLILAGGVERQASARSAIGVHQIYATQMAREANATRAASAAMSDAQRTTARIGRYLLDMGIDPELWLNAMETPPDSLFYLGGDDMTRLKIVTVLEQE